MLPPNSYFFLKFCYIFCAFNSLLYVFSLRTKTPWQERRDFVYFTLSWDRAQNSAWYVFSEWMNCLVTKPIILPSSVHALSSFLIQWRLFLSSNEDQTQFLQAIAQLFLPKDNDDNSNNKNKYLLNTYYLSGTGAECLIYITLFNLLQ